MSAKKTKTLIVGAGPGGLILGILLERAGLDYLILERAPKVKALGSAIALSSVVQPLLAQLGILPEIEAHSKPISGMTFMEEVDQSVIGVLSNAVPKSDTRQRYGYYTRVMPRPVFFDLLVKEIPEERLLFDKKVVSFVEEKDEEGEEEGGGGGGKGRVMVKCADGSVFETQILIGADGAYSTVRAQLYEQLKGLNILHEEDQRPLKLRQHCVVGVAEPFKVRAAGEEGDVMTMTPEEEARYHAAFEDPSSNFKIVISQDRKYMTWVMPAPENRVCWLLNRSYDEADAQVEQGSSTKEWGHEAAQEMINDMRGLKCPIAGTVGELVDRTPADQISKVMLEEKLFRTWYHGRTVMIGDAVHKLVPFSGEGGAQAILDAITLANALYDIPSISSQDIQKAFKEFYDERFSVAHDANEFSKTLTGTLNRRGWIGDIVRKVVFGNTPAFVMNMLEDKINSRRPQAIFLPIVDVPGLIKPRPQKQSERKHGEGPLAAEGTPVNAQAV
ncbi:hypothetical protein BGX29_005247 [Mortierella sp. GBA35]|nr:hypothetical protein BGX29_005247 [Mortierella sp. GBA35]